MLLLLALSTKSVLEGPCIYECIWVSEWVCVWERECGVFVGLVGNTPLRSHKGTLSPPGQRHLCRTKETKYDVGVCSRLELWYRKKKRTRRSIRDTDKAARHVSGSTSSIHVYLLSQSISLQFESRVFMAPQDAAANSEKATSPTVVSFISLRHLLHLLQYLDEIYSSTISESISYRLTTI